jgi:adenosylmethionine-8-amino-7-oxononanoate aminotransferase
LANLDVMRSEGLLDRAVPIGKRLADGLRTLVGSKVLDVRGDGAMWAAVLAEGVDAIAVRDRMLERGVIARPIGAGVMAFCPPLVITDEQIDRCVEAFSASL